MPRLLTRLLPSTSLNRLFICFSILAYVLGQGCETPSNMVGILAHSSTANSKFDEIHSAVPPATCKCDDAKQIFYHPTSEPIPDASWNTSQIALNLDTARGCADLCVCTEDGTCYTQQPGKNVYLELVPFCEGLECHMYGATFAEVYEGFTYDNMIDTNGNIYTAPDGYSEPVGKDTTYLKALSVSCAGCEPLKSVMRETCKAGQAF